MKITAVSVTYGRKFNLGDYNSAHIEMSLSAEVDEGENPQEIASQLFETAKAQVKENTIPLFRHRHATVVETFGGVPVLNGQQEEPCQLKD